MVPVLLNFFLTGVSHQPVGDVDQGMYSKYRLDGSLSDLRNEMTKTPEKMTLEASFADDTALMARKESDLYVIVNKLLKLFVSLSDHQP